MAGQTTQLPLAAEKAAALGEIGRLVPHIPGIVPVGLCVGRGRLAVAGAAEPVDPGAVQASRIKDVLYPAGRLYVRRSGPVAGLAEHPRLGGNQRSARRQPQLPSGVALEAAHDLRLWLKGAVAYSLIIGMSRGAR